jgi:16S rRNA A1518/A1519 N6-dimethyltransferase RsmA/KsgA/DIM1 with predicted DNA glycosylase/AP lyase activity
MPRGGHFAAMEEPQLLAEDLRTWFRDFRAESQLAESDIAETQIAESQIQQQVVSNLPFP